MEFNMLEMDILTFGLEDHLEKLSHLQMGNNEHMEKAKRIAIVDTQTLLNRIKAERQLKFGKGVKL